MVEQNIAHESALAAKAQAIPAAAPVAVATVAVEPAPILMIKLDSDRFRIFERIAAKENRPVKAVIGECMAGCAIQVARAEAQAMRAAAIASDERERSGFYNQVDLERGPSGPGYVEIQLALVG